MDSIRYDVAIVGYGPVGAILAGLLGLRGVRVIVFDREIGLYPLPRAAHIDHTGLRVLQELGCLDRLLPQMLRNPGTDCVNAERRILFQIPSDQLTPSGLPASTYYYQPTFDAELRRRVAEVPAVTVRLGSEVVKLVDRDTSVQLTAANADGEQEVVEVGWVVGCDGASSFIRQAVGIEYESFGFEEQWLVFDLKLAVPPPALPTRAVQVCDPLRPRTELPMPGSRFRFEFMVMPGDDVTEMLRPEVAEKKLLGPLVAPGSVAVERSATYTFMGMVATEWRRGHVFIAGDAAHLMPPFLGQGMCSGIRDATNLAWKLDRVIRGVAPEELLDTYTSERRSHVTHIIQVAVDFGRIICVTDVDVAAQRDRLHLVNPRPLDQRFRFSLPRLNDGALILDGGGRLFPQPLAINGEERLDDWIGQRFLVVGKTERSFGRSKEWWQRNADAIVRTIDAIPDRDGKVRQWLESSGAQVAVVRPDRYVLGVGDSLDRITDLVQPLMDRRVAR